jgi:hypothetical protein
VKDAGGFVGDGNGEMDAPKRCKTAIGLVIGV